MPLYFKWEMAEHIIVETELSNIKVACPAVRVQTFTVVVMSKG